MLLLSVDRSREVAHIGGSSDIWCPEVSAVENAEMTVGRARRLTSQRLGQDDFFSLIEKAYGSHDGQGGV